MDLETIPAALNAVVASILGLIAIYDRFSKQKNRNRREGRQRERPD